MRTSQTGINLIKQFEGLELEAYRDIAGIWTIGYGHTGSDVTPGQVITENEAEDLLRQDLVRFENGVNSSVKASISQNQFDALVSLSYNIGVNAFKKSTALRLLNKGDLLGAAEAITWWNKATINGVRREVLGLVRRRAAEADLFMRGLNAITIKDDDEPKDSTRVSPDGENSPRRGNIAGSRTVEGGAVAGAGGAAAAGAAMIDDDGTPNDPDGGTSPDDTIEPNENGERDCKSAEELNVTPMAGIADMTAEDLENTNSEVVLPCPEVEEAMTRHDYIEMFQIAAGIIAVIAILYILYARIDDWLKFRR